MYWREEHLFVKEKADDLTEIRLSIEQSEDFQFNFQLNIERPSVEE